MPGGIYEKEYKEYDTNESSISNENIIFSTGIIGLIVGYLFFNRCPARNIPNTDCIVSPADGIVTSIDSNKNKIDIFLNLQDVHCQRIPYDGVITEIFETDKTKNIITINTDIGDIIIERNAGYIAKTVITDSYIQIGNSVEKGDVFGRILLGSHTSIIIPQYLKIEVNVGDHILAGETIISNIFYGY